MLEYIWVASGGAAMAIPQGMENAQMHSKSYEEVRDSLKGLPATWYPALLATLVQECQRVRAFKPGGIQQFVAQLVVPGPPNPPKGEKPTEVA